ncbi:hypothetical protein MKW92_015698 [Papaver armeniacum]|nr:hypothetical protein MKW92_015698 [Papaver armeniacum]
MYLVDQFFFIIDRFRWRPTPSSSVFRLDVCKFRTWERLAPMISPRGYFACIGKTKCREILVAGGGSRHAMFSAAGRKVNSVECYNVTQMSCLMCWFFGLKGRTNGVWGYGEPRTVSVVFPVDEYYKDGVISELKNGGNWEMEGNWGEWERRKLGNVVVVDGGTNRDMPMVFMLDENDIFRYDNSSNRWVKESSIARKSPIDSSFGFAALNGDVHWSLQKPKATSPQEMCFAFHSNLLPQEESMEISGNKDTFPIPLDFKTAVVYNPTLVHTKSHSFCCQYLQQS